MHRSADKSLARPGRKQAQKHVRDARDFSNIETRAVVKFIFLQGKVPKEIDDILTETLACFIPGWAKDLTAPLYNNYKQGILLLVKIDYSDLTENSDFSSLFYVFHPEVL